MQRAVGGFLPPSPCRQPSPPSLLASRAPLFRCSLATAAFLSLLRAGMGRVGSCKLSSRGVGVGVAVAVRAGMGTWVQIGRAHV